MISNIHHVAVRVNDMEKYLSFYRGLSGMDVVVDSELFGEAAETFSDTPGVHVRAIILAQNNNRTGMVELLKFYSPSPVKPFPPDTRLPDIGGTLFLSFQVDNVDQYYREFKQKGIVFFSSPQTLEVPPLGLVKVVC